MMNSLFFLFGVVFEILSLFYIPHLVIIFYHLVGSVFLALFLFDKIYKKYSKLDLEKLKRINKFCLFDLTDKIPVVKIKFAEGMLNNVEKLNDFNKFRLLSYLTNRNISKKGDILKKVLSDNNDEIRLLAFSILSKEEDRLNKEILKRKELLKKKEDAYIYKELGELYWEFIFLQIADSELRDFYINLSKENFEKALELKEIKDIYFYLGRIYLMKKDLEKAEECFLKYINEKTIPYIAEIFYNKGELEQAKSLIEELKLVNVHQNFYFNYKVWK